MTTVAVGLLLVGTTAATSALVLPVLLVLVVLHRWGGLYGPSPLATGLGELPRLAGHTLLAWCAGCAAVAAVGPAAQAGAAALTAAVAGHAVAACAARSAVRALRRRALRANPRSALVVAAGEGGPALASALRGHPEYGMRPVALVVPQDRPPTVPAPSS
ncbi:nucleoside-diphosphate sugar epimerase/dehydratase, partial [Streptomyces otsuchiensis]|uniref:nucleoside-diphosphate sugar epimerase/dehydratase n=1 Tax=Streptomyces otsuchiensis TaxID=2681388 RepID=UPI0034D9572B